MEDLRTMMDSLPIVDINKNVQNFIHSAKGHGNRIKLTFITLNLIQESLELLNCIDPSDFISDVKSRVDEIDKQAKPIIRQYKEHLEQDIIISNILSDKSDNRISDLQSQIGKFLKEYDSILRRLVEFRDELQVENVIKGSLKKE